MDTETTETGAATETSAGEGETSTEIETVSVPKKDYDTLNQTLGSLKRELKDLKKAGKETHETPQTKPEDSSLLQKAYLRAAGITSEEEVDLALSTAKKWSMDIDKLVDDEDFTVKLEKLRTAKANAVATSNVRGGNGPSQAKNTPEYWIAKGTPPSPTDVPDRKIRMKIVRAMMDNTKNGKKFYND
jgi:hypothetical protein